MTEMQQVITDAAPAPVAAYSQGVRRERVVQVSGQLPLDPETGTLLHRGDVAAQTTLVLQNVGAVLERGGASFDDVIILRVYLADRDDAGGMNEAYETFMREASSSGVLPARTTIIVGLPLANALVEIDALAVISDPAA